MDRFEMRMADGDRERYGGPEWLTADIAGLIDDTPCHEQAAIESTTGVLLARAVEYPESIPALRLWLWLALRAEFGDKAPAWADFQPRVLRARIRLLPGGGVVPPDGSPPSTEGSAPA